MQNRCCLIRPAPGPDGKIRYESGHVHWRGEPEAILPLLNRHWRDPEKAKDLFSQLPASELGPDMQNGSCFYQRDWGEDHGRPTARKTLQEAAQDAARQGARFLYLAIEKATQDAWPFPTGAAPGDGGIKWKTLTSRDGQARDAGHAARHACADGIPSR